MAPNNPPINPNDALRLAREALASATEIKKTNEAFLKSIGPAITQALSPLLSSIREAIGTIKVEVNPNINLEPKFSVPDIHVPKADTPVVNVTVPEIKIPEIKIPELVWPKDTELTGFMRLIGWDRSLLETPLPVQIRDAKGRAIDFSAIGGGNTIVEGPGGGGFKFVTVEGFINSAFASLQNPDGRLRVELPSGASGLTDTELRASHLDVQQVSGSIDSVNVVSTVGLTDAQLRALGVPVTQVSGAGWSVTASLDTTSALFNSDNRMRTSTELSGSGGSVFATPATADGIPYSADNPMPVYMTSGASATTAVNVVDSSGVPYSGSNPLPTTASVTLSVDKGQGDAATALRVVVAGNSDMSVVVNNAQGPGEQATALRVLIAGDSAASVNINNASLPVTKSGVWAIDNPVAQGDAATALRVVIAGNSDVSVSVLNTISVQGSLSSATVLLSRSANPTKVANDPVPQAADSLGRTLTRPIQIRDLTKTAYATASTQAETTLIAAVAGAFLDAIMITGTNTSSAAVQIDIRATTGGSIVHTMYLPASTGPIGWSPQVPWPQDNQGNNWTFKNPGTDISNTNVFMSGLFSQEV